MTPPTASNTRGISMMLSACALIAATTIIAKGLGTASAPLHPLQVTAGRYVFGLLALLLASLVVRPRFEKPNVALHVGRVLSGWIGVTLMFTAVTLIPLADATAISFLNPVFGMILAIIFLGERIGWIRWAAAATALAGALILLRPGAGSFAPGALFALAAAAVLGVEITLIKLLSGREPPMQILYFSNGLGAVIAACAAAFVWHWPTGAQWAGLIGLGAIMVGAQALYVQAMRAADASFVLPFSYATLVFAAIYDAVVFGVAPDGTSWLGAAVILTGAGVLAWRETRLGRAGRA